ncbi:hypothetical protein EBR96_07350 [bacterium]|nr:hypothetical protein [bacterium]
MKSTGRDRHHIAQFTQFGLLALSAIANPWGTAGAFAFGSIGAVLASSAVAELSTSHQARQTAAALGGFAGGYFGFQLGTMGTTLTASTSVTSFASRKLDALSDMNFSEPGSETDTALATVGVTPSGIPTPTETATTIPVSASESDTGLESWSITSSQIPTADESATQLVSSTGSETTTFATTQSGLPAPSPDPTTTDVPSSALSASQRPSALPSPSAVMVRRQSESPISDKTEAILTGLLGGGVPVLFGGYLYFRDDSRRSGFINSVTNLPQAILVCFRHRTVIRHLERQVATVTEQRDQAVHNLAEVERERDLASMDLQIASRDLQIIKQERESDIAFTRLLKVMEERDAAIADAARIRTEYEAMQLKLKEGIADLDRRFPQFAPPNPATNEQQTQSNGK